MRLVHEAREQDPELSLNAAVVRIGQRTGVNPDTLRGWCKQADIDAGRRPGTTTEDSKRIKELEREVQELKRANEVASPSHRQTASLRRRTGRKHTPGGTFGSRYRGFGGRPCN